MAGSLDHQAAAAQYLRKALNVISQHLPGKAVATVVVARLQVACHLHERLRQGSGCSIGNSNK